MFGKVKEGSTAALIQLCAGYFVFYVITGITVKFFLSGHVGFPNMQGMEFLVYSTVGGMCVSLAVVLALRWYRFTSVQRVTIGRLNVPVEFLYIIPSGIFTAVVVPTTTLMYSFDGISVMVAMVLMRGSVIVIGRVVDAIQIRQGILKKTVYKEENIAVAIAIGVVGLELLGPSEGASPFSSLPVMVIFVAYVVSYAFRIYIMNYFKNTRPRGSMGNNKGFFAIEQITATAVIFFVTLILLMLHRSGVIAGPRISVMAKAVFSPTPHWWYWAILAGMAFGIVSFFSVFIFMFKGRTATFAGLVNRITSLIAPLPFGLRFWGNYRFLREWGGLGLIFVAVGFMARAEKKRAMELARNSEL